MSKLILGLVLSVAFMSAGANALPLPKSNGANMNHPLSLTPNYDFEGIVALSNCSGSLIRLENSKDSDTAMILTNGHCYERGMPRPGVFYVNQPSSRSFTLLNSSAKSVGQLTAS